jgi:hypothetical protein
MDSMLSSSIMIRPATWRQQHAGESTARMFCMTQPTLTWHPANILPLGTASRVQQQFNSRAFSSWRVLLRHASLGRVRHTCLCFCLPLLMPTSLRLGHAAVTALTHFALLGHAGWPDMCRKRWHLGRTAKSQSPAIQMHCHL